MQIIPLVTTVSPFFIELQDRLRELNMVYYASEAAKSMEFDNDLELDIAVSRAIEICVNASASPENHFKRIYLCSDAGIVADWKLSTFGYHLVCLNGNPANARVAHMQVQLIKSMS